MLITLPGAFYTNAIAETASPYTCGATRCDLYLNKKLLTAEADPKTLLNKRSEYTLGCFC